MPPRIVSTLLGHAHVGMALLCLGSLLRESVEPLTLQVHDDGTLTAEDLERLAAGLGEPVVVGRREADSRVEAFLGDRPAARIFRRENPLGLKLLDAANLIYPEVTHAIRAAINRARQSSHKPAARISVTS